MHLTELGHKIYDRAKQIIFDIENLEKDVRQFINGKDISVKISTECYTTYQWLPSALKNIQKVNQQVGIRIEDRATRNVLDYINSGKIDLGIVSKKDKNFKQLEYLELFKDQFMCVVNKNNSLASKAVIELKDFEPQEIFLYDVEDKESLVLDHFKLNGINPKKITKIPLTEAIIEMIHADMGVTIMANWVVKPYLKSKQIRSIPINYPSFTRTWYFSYLAKRKAELSNIPELLQKEICQFRRD